MAAIPAPRLHVDTSEGDPDYELETPTPVVDKMNTSPSGSVLVEWHGFKLEPLVDDLSAARGSPRRRPHSPLSPRTAATGGNSADLSPAGVEGRLEDLTFKDPNESSVVELRKRHEKLVHRVVQLEVHNRELMRRYQEMHERVSKLEGSN